MFRKISVLLSLLFGLCWVGAQAMEEGGGSDRVVDSGESDSKEGLLGNKVRGSHEELSLLPEDRGIILFEKQEYATAIPFLLATASKGVSHKGALAECYLEIGNYGESAKWYIQAALGEASLNIAGDNTNLIRIYSKEAFSKLKEGNVAEAESLLMRAFEEEAATARK